MTAPSNILTFLETVQRGSGADTRQATSPSQPVDSGAVRRIMGVLHAQPEIEVGYLQKQAEVDIFELGPLLQNLASLGAIQMIGTGAGQKVVRGPQWDSLVSLLS